MLFLQGSLGTKDDFVRAYGEQPLGKFIRGLVGLDRHAAKEAFGALLATHTLNAAQIRFLDMVIEFFAVKGVVEPTMLFEPPFTDINTSGIMGVFDQDTSTRIISLIRTINSRAEAV
jgi:type I restriction enzyme R subunit